VAHGCREAAGGVHDPELKVACIDWMPRRSRSAHLFALLRAFSKLAAYCFLRAHFTDEHDRRY